MVRKREGGRWEGRVRLGCDEAGKVSSELSDTVSRGLKHRGMKFVGTVIIYSYLQAEGVSNSHEETCFFR